MRKLILLGVVAAGSWGLQGCDLYEDAMETSFNDALDSTWSSDVKRSCLEDEAESAVYREVWNYMVTEIQKEDANAELDSLSITLDLGSTAPRLDLSNLNLKSYGDGSFKAAFDWKLFPAWTLSGAKIVIEGTLKKSSIDKFQFTYTDITLSADGAWVVFYAADQGKYYATLYPESALMKASVTAVYTIYGFDTPSSYAVSSPELGALLVEHVIFRAVCTELGYIY